MPTHTIDMELMDTNEKNARNINWHPAFVEAIQEDLALYKDVLVFQPEFQLTSAPLRVDVLVIKKEKDIQLEKKIVRIFKIYNVVEYKGPDDNLSVDDFYKVYAYLCLYKAFESVDITDLTLTFSLSSYPKSVFEHLEKVRGFKIEKKYNGIYYVTGDIVPMQFIINSELDEDENLFVNSLTKSLTKQRITLLLNTLAKKEEDINITAFADAIFRGNEKIFTEVTGMGDLSSLAELFEGTKLAQIWENQGIEKGIQTGIQTGIQEQRKNDLNILNSCSNLEEAKAKLMSM